MIGKISTNKKFYFIDDYIEVEHNDEVHKVAISLTRDEIFKLANALSTYANKIDDLNLKGALTDTNSKKAGKELVKITNQFIDLSFIDDNSLQIDVLTLINVELNKVMPR